MNQAARSSTQTRYLSLLALGLAAAGPALAADVRFDSHVGISALYTDNQLMATSSAAKESVTTGLLDLSGTLISRSQTSYFMLQPRGRFSKTSPDLGQNSSDGYLTLSTAHTGLKVRRRGIANVQFSIISGNSPTGTV